MPLVVPTALLNVADVALNVRPRLLRWEQVARDGVVPAFEERIPYNA